jgi:DNA-binding CsgD family transcriptional regulator
MSKLPPARRADKAPGADILSQVADALAWPLFVLRHDGLLLHANRAAGSVLGAGTPLLRQADRRVVPSQPERVAAFAEALSAAAAEGARRVLHWRGAAGSFTATLAPLAGAAGSTHEDLGAAGLVPVLLALALPGSLEADADAFAREHGLSPAETRVLQRLALGESSVQAAAALGLAAATVRSQTVSLRRKTGHASVAALQRTLAALPPLR